MEILKNNRKVIVKKNKNKRKWNRKGKKHNRRQIGIDY